MDVYKLWIEATTNSPPLAVDSKPQNNHGRNARGKGGNEEGVDSTCSERGLSGRAKGMEDRNDLTRRGGR